MKKLIFVIVSVGIIFFLYWGYSQKQNSSQNTGTTSASSTATSTVSQKIRLQNKRTAEETGTYEIRVVYPQIAGLSDTEAQTAVNNAIQNYIDGATSQFKEEIKDITEVPQNQKSGFFGDYSPVQLNGKIVSFKLNLSKYTAGAAHPNNYVHIFNYDVANKKQIAGLEEIFDSEKDYLKRLSDLSRESIKNQFNADWPALQSDVLEGTEPTQENFSEFGVGANTFNIYFNPYQVAPYATGVVEVKISYKDLKDILRDDFILKPE